MDLQEIKALLKKYRRGECTEAEVRLIEDWLDTLKNDNPAQTDDKFVEQQLLLAKTRIDQTIKPLSMIARRPARWLSAAASFVLIGSVTVLWFHFSTKQPAGFVASKPAIEKHIADGWMYVSTTRGITTSLKLPDGSRIALDASSRLRYPLKFVNHRRPVYLDEGEALFEVAKDKTSPFTVYTRKFATTALGTAFNIRSYSNEHRVFISLIHGKIRVEDLHPTDKNETVKILLPHQQIVLDKLSGSMVKNNFKEEAPVTSWKDGVLVFENASMDEVINTIENRFNVEITNKSNHTDWSYTGTFKNESLNDVIKTVCLTEGLTCTTNKSSIVLN